ncbi:hypothetical protein [Thiorhodovibrio frisius]|uniref:hypothetical protein n=1 Tax=Thiorhodovibrio frisius TaxID=631362 RepID=UPI00022C66A1|nr:hypothetical protein [Thiorhodovibrio frisius]WPL19980.1 hypothetical protein Thiofri_00026 [Thiorhodovibrio frisius]
MADTANQSCTHVSDAVAFIAAGVGGGIADNKVAGLESPADSLKVIDRGWNPSAFGVLDQRGNGNDENSAGARSFGVATPLALVRDTEQALGLRLGGGLVELCPTATECAHDLIGAPDADAAPVANLAPGDFRVGLAPLQHLEAVVFTHCFWARRPTWNPALMERSELLRIIALVQGLNWLQAYAMSIGLARREIEPNAFAGMLNARSRRQYAG